MKWCSIEAFARCPLDERCKDFREASYMEGSECDRFNYQVAHRPMTNSDKFRTLSDEDLAKFLVTEDDGNFVISVCDDKYCDTENCCNNCGPAALRYLQSPAKEEDWLWLSRIKL